jgi:hypothetical protein
MDHPYISLSPKMATGDIAVAGVERVVSGAQPAEGRRALDVDD